jgi:hypothetical protein
LRPGRAVGEGRARDEGEGGGGQDRAHVVLPFGWLVVACLRETCLTLNVPVNVAADVAAGHASASAATASRFFKHALYASDFSGRDISARQEPEEEAR